MKRLPLVLLLVLGSGNASIFALDAGIFIRGDTDGDSKLNITDAVVILNHLFQGSERLWCNDAADVNDDGDLNLTDAIFLLDFLFRGGEQPAEPFPNRGKDPTEDDSQCVGCGKGPSPYAGEVCGLDGASCVILEDVELASSRARGAAVALDSAGLPHVVLSIADGGSRGRYARRTEEGDWVLEDLVSPDDQSAVLVKADLVIDPNDRPLVLTYGGAFNSQLWLRRSDGWQLVEELVGAHASGSASLVQDSGGCLHAALLMSDSGPSNGAGVGIRADDWRYFPLGNRRSVVNPVLALSTAGVPHIAFWEAAAEIGWLLRWSAGLEEPEAVRSLGRTLRSDMIALAVTPDDRRTATGRPHILVEGSDEGGLRLEYMSRGPDGAWATYLIAGDEHPDCGPLEEGATCEFDYQTFLGFCVVPLESGDARVLFGRRRHMGSVTGTCDDRALLDPRSPCFWDGPVETQGELRWAWVDRGVVRQAVMLRDVTPSALDIAIADSGEIHLAFCEAGVARYLRLGRQVTE